MLLLWLSRTPLPNFKKIYYYLNTTKLFESTCPISDKNKRGVTMSQFLWYCFVAAYGFICITWLCVVIFLAFDRPKDLGLSIILFTSSLILVYLSSRYGQNNPEYHISLVRLTTREMFYNIYTLGILVIHGTALIISFVYHLFIRPKKVRRKK